MKSSSAGCGCTTTTERSSSNRLPVDIPGYTIDRLIAEGASASVYLALQQSLGRTVALKVLDKLDNAEQSARFLAEGELIASLNHRNINTIYDVGRVGDRHYLAMEYLEGGSLAERIAKGMRLSAVLDVLESMAACLDFLHSKGIVHRDVKPGNILFHADGTAKLTDFGIAKQLGRDQQLTMDGTALGSPHYLSPEQATNQPLDGRSDIYSLGVVFYEMLTGRKPFSEDSHVQTIVAHINQPVPKLPEHLATYQPLLERMMAKEPHERFGSAAELLGYVRGIRQTNPEKEPAFWQTPAYALGSSSLLVATLVTSYLLWPTPAVQGPTTPAAVAEAPAAVEMVVAPSTAAAVSPPAITTPTPVAEPPAPVAEPPTPVTAPPAPVAATPAPITEPPAPVTTTPSPIESWLASAEQAYRDNRLTFPKDDSALAYYNRVLAEQPGNPAANAGVARIVERYHDMASRALERGETGRARRYAARGLNIDPQHAGLKGITEQLAQRPEPATAQRPAPAAEQQPDAVEKAVENVKSWWQRNIN